jgi:hypothetical protein
MLGIFKKRRLGAIVAACFAAAALAAAAVATPLSTLVPINGTGDSYQLGATGSCKAGQDVKTGASIDWQENTSTATRQAKVIGDFCLQKTRETYRVELVYYTRDLTKGTDTLLGRYYGDKTVGNGSSLQTTAVAKQGPRLSSSALNHVHVVIQKFDSSTSTWSDADSNVYSATLP